VYLTILLAGNLHFEIEDTTCLKRALLVVVEKNAIYPLTLLRAFCDTIEGGRGKESTRFYFSIELNNIVQV
jgi:hypothetical protein